LSRPFPDPAATLPEALERAARHFPTRGIAVFEGRGAAYTRRTYEEILAAARLAAGRWAAVGVGAGDRVLVVLPTSWEWLDAWLGALLAGALPVAVAPGAALGAGEAQVRKVDALAEHLGARFAVVPPPFRVAATGLGARRAAAAAITADELAARAPARAAARRPEPEDVAFLQLCRRDVQHPVVAGMQQHSRRAAADAGARVDGAHGRLQ